MSDIFGAARRRANSSVPERRPNEPQQGVSGPQQRMMASRESMRPQQSIRIRRLPSSNSVVQVQRPTSRASSREDEPLTRDVEAGRRRSMSAPQHYNAAHLAPQDVDLSRQYTTEDQPMQTITEGEAAPQSHTVHVRVEYGRPQTVSPPPPSNPDGSDISRVASQTSAHPQSRSPPLRSRAGSRRLRSNVALHQDPGDYDDNVVQLLDLIDPEVQTIGTLTNVQNSLFVPDLGGFINRRPTYDLSRRPTAGAESIPAPRSRAGTLRSRPTSRRQPKASGQTLDEPQGDAIEMHEPRRTFSLDSRMSDSRYAVLPHGVSLEGWTDEDIDELNDHVRHLLHSRREGVKRSWKGFRQYCKKPLGLFVTVYAVLVTLFGTAWVFCLIGWIYVGSKQDYFINVIDNVLVALFALIGDGMAPFRVVDTYHMCFIAHYHHLTWRLRKEKALPTLVDHNDLPNRRLSAAAIEDVVDKEETAEFSVLTPLQQRRLQYHQAKFSKAHTFYKPHETSTHHAFPLRLMIASVVLLDFHSIFQVALGTCTWSIDYRVRPQALTATILACSLTCNIVAGIIISIGDKRTRKKDVLERIFRQGLTEQAIRHVRQKHTEGEADITLNPDEVRNAPGESAPPQDVQKLVDSKFVNTHD
ncbi:Hypothetical protein R9X50_00714800 [Acrodontium crateriforme]|uniref:Integral membrane protein n=1 Tax=Acrodontium crateriforme TaxID=150365 RepID=A0AAQ3RAI5_9PEZI|nr:Hypothetical protein R9X50_00714800 [Acrodontium crateriforme]